MKTTLKLFAIIFFLCMVSSCDKNQDFSNENFEASKMELKSGKMDIESIVTGSGHATRTYLGVEGVWRTFTINAKKYEDGSVEGTFQLNDHEMVMIHGKVICMTVMGNVAYLITETTHFKSDGIPVSEYGRCKVVDNGEGKNADPDQISFLYQTGNPAYYCETPFEEWHPEIVFELHDVESGNIQVH